MIQVHVTGFYNCSLSNVGSVLTIDQVRGANIKIIKINNNDMKNSDYNAEYLYFSSIPVF